MFVAGLPGLTAAVLPVRGRDGVNGGALFAGGMGGVGRVGQACPGLACIVVELHEAEDQVCGHELKLIRWVRDHIPAKNQMMEKIKLSCSCGKKAEDFDHEENLNMTSTNAFQ